MAGQSAGSDGQAWNMQDHFQNMMIFYRSLLRPNIVDIVHPPEAMV